MTIPSHVSSQLGRVLAGQFRIDALLGQGGMGSVYKGVQLSVNRPVAIKLITPTAPNQDDLVKRFRREAEATARLSHPNTVRLFEFGVTDTHELYMVMELLEGSDLAQQLQSAGRMPLAESLLSTRQVLSALSEAHAHGIVHRDLKPGNVFLSRVQGGAIFVKVMDFGIAGIEQAQETRKLTMTGAVMGTPAYMSPEQAQGKAVDARSDLYSLGVMLFEMLSGRLPFEADTVVSLLLAHVTQPPPRLAEVGLDFPQMDAVQRLLDSLLAKDPNARPVSALAALEMVDAMSSGSRGLAATHNTPTNSPIARVESVSPQTPLGWSVTASPQLSSARRSRALWLGTSLAIALGALLAWRARAPVVNTATAATTSTASATHVAPVAAQDPTPANQLMRVTIASTPNGASVLLAGAVLGKTPYELEFRHTTEVSVALTGRVSQTLTVTKDSEPNLVVELPPLRRVEPVKRAPVASADNLSTATEPKRALVRNEPSVPSAETEPPVPSDETEPLGASSSALPSTPSGLERRGESKPTADPPTPAGEKRGVGGTVLNFVGNLFGGGDQRARREAMLKKPPPFRSVRDAERAHRARLITPEAFGDAVWVLKALRLQRIKVEKDNLHRGTITPQEYERRVDRIKAEVSGQ